MDELRGKVAFVTGAAGGIGLGIAQALAKSGMKVALADIDVETLERSVQELRATDADVVAVALDVTDRENWSVAAEQVGEALGPVQVLCNNAGVSTLGLKFSEITPELWDKVVDVNLTSAFNGIHTFLESMRGIGEGHIVNTSSMGGLFGSVPELSAYTATKFGIVGLSESLRAELAEVGVGVSVLCPGGVHTRLWRTSRRVRGLPDTDVPPADVSGQSASPSGMAPYEVGVRVVHGIRNNELYVLTHPEFGPLVEDRHTHLLAAIEAGREAGRTQLP